VPREKAFASLRLCLEQIAERQVTIEEGLEWLATVLLSQNPPPPEAPILSKRQRRIRREREGQFCEALARAIDDEIHTQMESMEWIQEWFARAALSPEERVVAVAQTVLPDYMLAAMLGVSPRTVSRLKASGGEKLRAASQALLGVPGAPCS
jgi:hypothetical protein